LYIDLIKVSVLIDDRICRNKNVKAVHGLSLYIEFRDKHILFDTGPNPDILQFNVEKLDVDLELLDYVVISHEHPDHYSGLPYIGWTTPLLKTYIPYGSWETIGLLAKKNDLQPIEVNDWLELDNNITITKPIHGPPYEHFLVTIDNGGLIVFTGCFHPNPFVLRDIAKRFNTRIKYLIGGLHFSNGPQHVIDTAINVFEEIGIEKIAPLHCTHDRLINRLKERGFDIIAESCCGGVFKLE